jgi:hypothetical protein
METYYPERVRKDSQQSTQTVPPLVRLESLTISESFRADLRRDFFGTKLDRQKSFFAFSMLALIGAFFVVSAFNLPLGMIIGLIFVSYGSYGTIKWTRHFLKECN